MYDGLGNWREINEAGAKIQAVTAEDIQRVARTYFNPETSAVGIYLRKPGTGTDEDPDLAGLSPEQKPIIRQFMAQLNAEADVERLRAGREQMASRVDGADAKQQQFFKIILKKMDARIAELEAGE